MVALLPITWVLVTPFAVAAAVAGAPGVNRFVARHLWPVVASGWLGVAMVVAGAFAAHGPQRALLLAVGAPLCGLAVWMRGGSADDERHDGCDDEGDPRPSDDEIDWDRFLADLERWRVRPRERAPAT